MLCNINNEIIIFNILIVEIYTICIFYFVNLFPLPRLTSKKNGDKIPLVNRKRVLIYDSMDKKISYKDNISQRWFYFLGTNLILNKVFEGEKIY